MRASRVAILLWVALIVLLLVVEFAEITHVFTLPVANAFSDPLALLIALIWTTILALTGAIFIGVYVSHRILSPTGFTRFEEEMLRMRSDLRDVKRDVEAIRERSGETTPANEAASEENR